jgi:hypothetical protein
MDQPGLKIRAYNFTYKEKGVEKNGKIYLDQDNLSPSDLNSTMYALNAHTLQAYDKGINHFADNNLYKRLIGGTALTDENGNNGIFISGNAYAFFMNGMNTGYRMNYNINPTDAALEKYANEFNNGKQTVRYREGLQYQELLEDGSPNPYYHRRNDRKGDYQYENGQVLSKLNAEQLQQCGIKNMEYIQELGRCTFKFYQSGGINEDGPISAGLVSIIDEHGNESKPMDVMTMMYQLMFEDKRRGTMTSRPLSGFRDEEIALDDWTRAIFDNRAVQFSDVTWNNDNTHKKQESDEGTIMAAMLGLKKQNGQLFGANDFIQYSTEVPNLEISQFEPRDVFIVSLNGKNRVFTVANNPDLKVYDIGSSDSPTETDANAFIKGLNESKENGYNYKIYRYRHKGNIDYRSISSNIKDAIQNYY